MNETHDIAKDYVEFITTNSTEASVEKKVSVN